VHWQPSRIRIDGWLSRSEARTQCGLLGFERRVTELAELATLEKSRYQMFLAAGRSGLIHKTKVTQQLVKCMRNQRSTMKSRSVCATTEMRNRGIQSDEIETISQQKATDEQRLLLANSRHDQDFSSSRLEASRQMAAARDIALRQGWLWQGPFKDHPCRP